MGNIGGLPTHAWFSYSQVNWGGRGTWCLQIFVVGVFKRCTIRTGSLNWDSLGG